MLPVLMTFRDQARRTDDFSRLGEGSASRIDKHFTVDHDGMEGAQGNHARRSDDFTGTNIECAIVKIAFDGVAFHATFRQRAGAVGAVVIGYKEVIAEVEYGECQTSSFNLDDTAFGDVDRRTKF